ncbi:zinc-ribbon domain-containing protein [Tsuneonella sp. YG55]|uniref:Zinc-ribbon domain-containing protein n=1 Tax=Tsuneonella litorea TaxID=2976475 RepID=A0A9X2W2L3_9SPHN|nr:zinc-ribbon domain-containing protein [Tsuneonella litorea]MCT2559947.1 zinc-ribbon domain-containing protein [Tsuneonella litorea]
MIIACPACATRYVVPDSAIGAEGRTVRCAKCRHSWFQDGPELELAAPGPAPAPAAAPAPAPSPAAEATIPVSPPVPPPPPRSDPGPRQEPAPAPEAAPPPPASAGTVSDAAQPERAESAGPAAPTVVEAEPAPIPEEEDYGEEVSAFDYEPPFRPRRNMVKVWTIAAALFAALALGTVAAVSYWGLPDWVPISRPTFAIEQPDLVLDFPRDQQERRTLPNGTEYFGASGTVKNVGRETRKVPSILIVLSDARDRIVYTWEIASPKPELAPGETVTINEAVTDIPKSARYVEIGWKPD